MNNVLEMRVTIEDENSVRIMMLMKEPGPWEDAPAASTEEDPIWSWPLGVGDSWDLPSYDDGSITRSNALACPPGGKLTVVSIEASPERLGWEAPAHCRLAVESWESGQPSSHPECIPPAGGTVVVSRTAW